MPRGDFRGSGGKPYAPGDGRLAPRPQPDPAERPARPVPRSDFRDDRQNGKGYGPGDGRVMPQPAPRYGTRNPGGTSAPPTESVVSPQPRPVPRSDFRGNGSGKSYAPSDRRVMPQPQPAAQSRYERPMVRETTRPSAPSPRYQAPAVRQPAPAPRYERPVARETARPAPAPREAPPSRPTRETRSSSQNGTRDDEPWAQAAFRPLRRPPGRRILRPWLTQRVALWREPCPRIACSAPGTRSPGFPLFQDPPGADFLPIRRVTPRIPVPEAKKRAGSSPPGATSPGIPVTRLTSPCSVWSTPPGVWPWQVP